MYKPPTRSHGTSPSPRNSHPNPDTYTFTSSLNGWKYVIKPNPNTGLFHCFCSDKGYTTPDGKAFGRHLRGYENVTVLQPPNSKIDSKLQEPIIHDCDLDPPTSDILSEQCLNSAPPTTMATIPDGSNFPYSESDPFNIGFSGSEAININTMDVVAEQDPGPRQAKIEFFDGLERVGISITPSQSENIPVIKVPMTIEDESPPFDSEFTITSSLVENIDIAENYSRIIWNGN
ncbi:hypothetical protein HOY82DRAFT_544376 [Tuber indicum]|nr:hypothetical protein HOY82DRAFT_544376 [Tuber indicum]